MLRDLSKCHLNLSATIIRIGLEQESEKNQVLLSANKRFSHITMCAIVVEPVYERDSLWGIPKMIRYKRVLQREVYRYEDGVLQSSEGLKDEEFLT